jgi:hypothetical protein
MLVFALVDKPTIIYWSKFGAKNDQHGRSAASSRET